VRARLKLGAALVGFLVLVTEFLLALDGVVSFGGGNPRVTPLPPAFLLPSPGARIVFYLPAILLGLASLLGGVALHRTARGRSRWSWYVAALAPVVAFLALYKPPISHAQLPLVGYANLPWVAISRNSWNMALSLGLQIAVYVAAAAYVLAIVLALPRGQPRKHQIIGGLVVFVAVACVLALALLSGSASPAFPEEVHRVQDTFHTAMVLSRTAGYVSPERTSLAYATRSALPTSAQLAETKQKAFADLATYFSPAVIVDRLALGVNNAIAAQENPNARLLGAGVSNITYKSVSFDPSGSKATVEAAVTAWAGMAQRNPDGTWVEGNPSNVVNVTAEMVKQISGNWLITTFSWDFAPGSEP
jgi:hypothetical protein